ncbi:MAG: G1 family glutamic endopeptidase [Gaiellaceae bacterium]
MLRLLASLLAASAVAAAATTGGTASTTHFAANAGSESLSSNWSGYAIGDTAGTGLQFTSVTGTWRQPKAKCVGGSAGSAAFWVGLGGESDASTGLEQTGTSVDCNANGTARYYAWYELLPAAAVEVPLKVRAGDLITTSVNVNGNTVLVQIKNRTRRTSFTKAITTDVPDLTSAEWIAEAPSLCNAADRCTVVPLANFGTMTFTRAAAIASTHPGTISDSTWSNSSIRLVPDSAGQFSRLDTSTAGATPGALSADGRSFPVTWLSDSSA